MCTRFCKRSKTYEITKFAASSAAPIGIPPRKTQTKLPPTIILSGKTKEKEPEITNPTPPPSPTPVDDVNKDAVSRSSRNSDDLFESGKTVTDILKKQEIEEGIKRRSGIVPLPVNFDENDVIQKHPKALE